MVVLVKECMIEASQKKAIITSIATKLSISQFCKQSFAFREREGSHCDLHGALK